MTREEMLTLLGLGLSALKVAIIKWEQIVEALNNHVDLDDIEIGSENCALCEADDRLKDKKQIRDYCKHCIIFIKTNNSHCDNSEYRDFESYFFLDRKFGLTDKDYDILKDLAIKELEFLKSLKE